jgi:two-component system NtrC family sensor kinase
MGTELGPTPPTRWELAAEAIAIKIRWFGLVVGYFLANFGPAGAHRPVLNAILVLGAFYALLDTYYSFRGRIFLQRFPMLISCMEALFIGLLCFFQGGLESSFRYYYLLSLICCAIRHRSFVTYATCALHCASFTLLYLALPQARREPLVLFLTLIVLGWVTWAGDALALLLKRVSDHLVELNNALRENQSLLEKRIEERTGELREAQAHLLHQEKMAAFGLLAAGIAHEVGNPLTSISTLVQMLQQRDCDAYTRAKLALVLGQLQRIQNILRELINFSRPASTASGRVEVREILDEALNIAKYYKRTKGRTITSYVEPALPPLHAVRDQLVQAVLNLVLNAIDATAKGGLIELLAEREGASVALTVRDDGSGISVDHVHRMFEPYFTTKKQGTGLGLFVTKKLVADHGGTVEFTSSPRRGTEFRIVLPVAVGEAPAPMPSERAPHVAAVTP